jgi:YidC/Oxa1 family membrane protein insertase
VEKRTIITLLLIFIVFWISNQILWRTPEEEPVQQPRPEIVEEPYTEEVSYEEPTRRTPLDLQELDEEEVRRDDIRIENDKMALTFTNQGAMVNEVILKEYYLADKTSYVNLIPENEALFGITLHTTDGTEIDLSEFRFQYDTSPDNKRVSFTLLSDAGSIQLTYELNDEYNVHSQFVAEGIVAVDNYDVSFLSGIADTEEYLKNKSREYNFAAQIDNSITRERLSRISEPEVFRGNIDWSVIRSKYFILSLIPDDMIDTNSVLVTTVQESPAFSMNVSVPRESIRHSYDMYLGPLLYDNLNRYNIGLENNVELGPGIIQWISKIFLWFLQKLNNVIPNWGICIIIFALVLKIILYPLTHKSFESTTKMQKINPLMKEIQTKYKDDPKKLQAELRNLYKEHKVNPLGGCLPLLLQAPVLFALYPLLRYSIELRQTHFLWLPDLSEPDPYMILPIIMALFMFVQQKMMAPSKQASEEMDEKQQAAYQSQKMMAYIMPVVLFFIFRTLPAGLVLYWTVFNVMSIFQQYFIKKKLY